MANQIDKRIIFMHRNLSSRSFTNSVNQTNDTCSEAVVDTKLLEAAFFKDVEWDMVRFTLLHNIFSDIYQIFFIRM